jgi:hypothetical protein
MLMVVALAWSNAAAQEVKEPASITYQGVLTDQSGNPVSGEVQVKVSLYSAPTDGSLLWSDNYAATPRNGQFSVVLGRSGNQLPSFTQGNVYVELQVTNPPNSPMIPRQKLTSVPYAMNCASAQVVYDEIVNSATPSVTISGLEDDPNIIYTLTTNLVNVDSRADFLMVFNDDWGAHYSFTWVTYDGSAISGYSEGPTTKIVLGTGDVPSQVTTFHGTITGALTGLHSLTGTVSERTNGANGTRIKTMGGVWHYGYAITKISIISNGGNIGAGSRVTLWARR